MSGEREVPKGYKRTEVGVIPGDWSVAPLRELIQRTEYGSSAPSKRTGHVPVLRMGNIQAGKIDWTDLVYTDDSREMDRFAVHCGDVLFNRTNTIDLVGKTAIFDDTRSAAFAGYLIRITAKPERLDPRYLNYVMNTSVARAHGLKVLSVAVGQANINAEKLRSYPIPLPPCLAEQRAIADALGDVDALLDALDRQIAKQRDLKQAAMQQLLTGRTRLPGFTGEWQHAVFGDVAQIRNTKIVPASAPAGTRCVELDNLSHTTGRLLGTIAATGTTAKYAFQAGDVLFGRLRAYLRKYWLATFDGLCSTEIWPLVPRDDRLGNTFLHLTVQMDRFVDAAGVSYGTHMPRSDWTVLRNFEVKLPPVPEQTAIATVLSDMDAEIAALEARRAKTADLKQAMMQELLTGRTRLV